MKRVLLFLATNLAVILLLSIVASLLGFGHPTGRGGALDLGALLGFAAVFGFGGSFISLWISKWMAKRSTGAEVIDTPRNDMEAWLLDTVARQAKEAGIAMPEVAIYPSPEINAFATGPSKNNALVAVSVGLLEQMSPDEAEAVLAHEVSHVANGDMVTLTLIQGVVNTFVIFIARIIGHIVDQFLRSNDNENSGYGIGYMITVFIAEMVLGIFASVIVMWFSRQREFRADAGGARLAGREKMIAALERLRALHEPSHLPDAMLAFGIGSRPSSLGELFMTHPPLEQRIEALRRG